MVTMASTTAQKNKKPEGSGEEYGLKFMTLQGDGMPVVIDAGRVPIKAYTNEIEPDCYQQLLDLANSPVPVGHVSCMPDVHLGKGATVGSVFASEKYVAPMAVGVDIGCGMIAVPVEGLFRDDPKLTVEKLTAIQKAIKRRIPTGNGPEGAHKSPVSDWPTIRDAISRDHAPTPYLEKALSQPAAGCQMGTLGGGNHFIEMLHGEADGQIWLMVHSGSRRIGNETATHYDKLAKQQMKTLGRQVYGQLYYLDTDSQEGKNYLQDMSWCQAYAYQNRRRMLQFLSGVVEEATGHAAALDRIINVHHNYCQRERCTFYDPNTKQMETRDLWVTRKGATSARKGEYGIIPGSMGVGSYIVKGKGNADSWQSCSHGAGRRMSRTKALKVIDQRRFEDTLKGVVCDRNASLRDEAPDAYKDLTVVMKNQESLIEIVHRLLPLVNVKGF
jgi:tRNA-splicing ligase RtcB